MELVIEPTNYAPETQNGEYVDRMPSWGSISPVGITCDCSCRPGRVYKSYSSFNAHLKTQGHKHWIETMNIDRTNYYVENKELKKQVQTYKIIVGERDREIIRLKNIMNQNVSRMLAEVDNPAEPAMNLLDF